ncbi:potassium-transporting ATPase subunit C [Pseudonocardia abyssalis]|uniref:Potassium-transporting ATPase KdpC subunit n=1 Tax=Pseudonocardia abyssalis TaxID=2792008 RepID=A0ABS6URS1_9PSEU|nr:potassium-transporting ATPase subunit C [Pseudonocardia abyssalis]MBW0114967.1 potassium-transporting ATPase subunit C [Pseudonocardia abyssalis]MBW0134636.1 potassium-transporting ATPase subunit C [Pseudonocardia abyssalis]
MLTSIARQSGAALRVLLVMTLLLGVVYPLGIWAIARIPGLSGPAEGSVIHSADGTAVGSSLIGIDPVASDPTDDPWFHARPSATAEDELGLGPGDPSTSAGANLGGFDEGLVETIAARREAIAAREGVDVSQVPVDAVSSSASGIDPGISPEYAALQVARVARVTGLPLGQVQALVADATTGRVFGFLGEPTVNVTELNLAVAGARG